MNWLGLRISLKIHYDPKSPTISKNLKATCARPVPERNTTAVQPLNGPPPLTNTA